MAIEKSEAVSKRQPEIKDKFVESAKSNLQPLNDKSTSVAGQSGSITESIPRYLISLITFVCAFDDNKGLNGSLNAQHKSQLKYVRHTTQTYGNIN